MSNPPAASMISFHSTLQDYVNGGKAFFTMRYLRSHAPRVSESFRNYSPLLGEEVEELQWFNYTGSDTHLNGLREFLRPIEKDLVTVLLHGSTADGRTTGYSDVDALVVLRDHVFFRPDRLAKVAYRLSCAKRFMLQYDPLQHHGWFVMTERDFTAYPEHVLPLVTLQDAKVLIGETHAVIHTSNTSPDHYRKIALRQTDRIIALLDKGWRPSNSYQLKSLLSEFMMLPVHYVQAKSGTGCSKRNSFQIAESDFSKNAWQVMDQVSEIRLNWSFQPNWLAGYVYRHPAGFFRKLSKRWPAPISATIRPVLTHEFYSDMLMFARETRSLLS